MRIVYLSDHAGKMLDEAECRRLQAEFAIGAAETQAGWADHERRNSWKNRPRWRRLLRLPSADDQEHAARAELARREVARCESEYDQADQDVQRQQVGVDGEKQLVADLASVLSDEWVALCGYRNRGGETDVVLVGPAGVWAVEVKSVSGRLDAVGEVWRIVKHDRWGNEVSARDATDSRGRPWARQVDDVARQLAGWLDQRHHPTQIRTAVLVMLDTGRVGRVERPGVDLVADHTQQLLDAMADYSSLLSEDSCAAIQELVERDHRFHNGGRRGSSGRS